jgi:predicted ester cyclase
MSADFGAAFLAAAEARSAEGVRAALSPAFAGKANGRPLDRDAQVRLLESFWAGFPDGRFQWTAVGGSGRQVLTWTLAGTHGGDYLGIPATGLPVTLSGFTIAVWNATGITSLDWKWDTKAFASQVMGAEDLEGAVLGPPQHRPDPGARWAREEQRLRGRHGGRKGQGKPGQKPGQGQGPGQQAKTPRGQGRGRKPRPGGPPAVAPPAEGAAATAEAAPDAAAAPAEPAGNGAAPEAATPAAESPGAEAQPAGPTGT